MKHNPVVATLILATLLLSSCLGPFQRTFTQVDEMGKGVLVLSIQPSPGPGRTLLPSIEDRTPISFNLSGSGPAGSVFTRSSLSSGNHQIPDLLAGIWTIEATGQNSSGAVIAYGQITTEILAGETNSITLVLHAADGTGGFEIFITWPATVVSPNFEVTLAEIPTGANAQSLSVNLLSATSAEVIQYSITTGSHMLRVGLYDDTDFLCAPMESVIVLNGVMTIGTMAILPEHIKRAPSAPIDLQAEALSDTLVRLTWSDTSSTEEYFIIEWQDEGTTIWTELPDQIPPNTSSFDAPAPASGALRHYRIKAVNSFGSSAWSNEVSAMARVAIDPDWFTDLNLRQAVADTGWTWIDEATTFDGTGRNISDLSGIEKLVDLQWLVLSNNQISTISQVSSLVNLQYLHLSDNDIINAGPLSSLVGLQQLVLDNNLISDLAPLAGLTELFQLYISSNGVSNLGPLAGLVKMQNLHLAGNQIDDISALAGLTELQILHLEVNSITDVQALAGLHKLEIIGLAGNSIVSGVSSLVSLTNAIEIDFRDSGNSGIPLSDRATLSAALSGCTIQWPPLPSNYAIGDMGPAGGIVFYENLNHVVDGWRYLEAWTADETGTYQWKTSQSPTPGTTTAIGSGYANTYGAMSGTEYPAAEAVKNASYNGFTDWFLPSKDELNLMYEQRGSIGSLSSDAYWSSSEGGTNDGAWEQFFIDGTQNNHYKDWYNQVRVVRAFRTSSSPLCFIYYHSNTADSGTIPSDTYLYESGETVTISTNSGNLARSGYLFAGWNTQPDGSGTNYTPSSTVTISASLILYARWIIWGDDYTSSNIGTLKYVPAGTFQRDGDLGNLSTISQPFRMSQYEISRAQFLAVMGTDPSSTIYSTGTDDPVQMVNWYHALAFCNKLSLAESLTPVYTVVGINFNTLSFSEIPTSNDASWDAAVADWGANGYRLPSEMEWMWAAIGADIINPGAINTIGYTKLFAGSNGSNNISDYAWYDANSGGTTHPVGSKLANELGLYDISGNIWEWNWDWYDVHPAGSLMDYRGTESNAGAGRAGRGGNWDYDSSICAVAARDRADQYYQNDSIGFRVVRP
ncbi:MAG: hypothetical protein A3J97_04990 [Spirochaetes bacterium RIFOXYC1_FULL_54_7]|nr:MAG: hypothetical protein A3J97_04990 [Spirochaetes bacterium RIFOXYC1_FULL_54_7]